MPLRNERQAYWDDIENHIARVQPLTASQALDRVCPDAAAERLALKSRLRDVEEQTRQVHRLRARAAELRASSLQSEVDATKLKALTKIRAQDEQLRQLRVALDGAEAWRETGRAPSAASSNSRSSRKCTLALTHRRSAPPRLGLGLPVASRADRPHSVREHLGSCSC